MSDLKPCPFCGGKMDGYPDYTIHLSVTEERFMSDLISRQAAIDALDALCDRECEYSKKQRSVMCGACRLGSAFDAIEDLPSAQSEIIRCRECKHYYYADNRIPQEQMYVCDLDGDRWSPDSYCSYAERKDE